MIPFDVDQAGWGSATRYANGTKQPWRVDKWVLHWGGGPNPGGNLPANVLAEESVLRAWQRYHMGTKGWEDIAYNYAIGQSGLIYRLRGENRAGATSGDLEPDGIPENHEARAVVFILGEGQEPTAAAYTAFQKMWITDPLRVTVHSDHKSTACPGDDVRAWVAEGGYNTVFTPHQIQVLKDVVAGIDEVQDPPSSGYAIREAIWLVRKERLNPLHKHEDNAVPPHGHVAEVHLT